jgi:two-component system copper resistance phosphate regulon response regulator CusR
MRVLVIEDNARLAAAVVSGLRDEQIDATAAGDGAAALAAIRQRDVDVVVLDLGLPDIDGEEVLRIMRAEHIAMPVLVLTARDAVTSRVSALDAGADDYLVKPFAFEELLARLRALARRATGPRWAPVTAAGLEISDDLSVRFSDRRVTLSPREHALLVHLARRRGEVVSRQDLLRDVFGYEFDPGTNVIDVHLAHLRKKLAGAPLTIETIRGAGIRLEVTP